MKLSSKFCPHPLGKLTFLSPEFSIQRLRPENHFMIDGLYFRIFVRKGWI